MTTRLASGLRVGVHDTSHNALIVLCLNLRRDTLGYLGLQSMLTLI